MYGQSTVGSTVHAVTSTGTAALRRRVGSLVTDFYVYL